jgi:hypothetical protein
MAQKEEGVVVGSGSAGLVAGESDRLSGEDVLRLSAHEWRNKET